MLGARREAIEHSLSFSLLTLILIVRVCPPDCDFRLAKVPAKDHKKGAMRRITGGRAQYPRYVGDDRGDAYAKDKLVGGLYDWQDTKTLGSIPEVEHTYGYLDGDYGIQNEHQLSMGESTCGGTTLLAHPPVFDGGKALLEMAELSRIAMERCKTARCAAKTMGDLAVRYGFYGAVWKGENFTVAGEAGEALTITDTAESWMFHIIGDDTGTSAVWVAQRVPEGHVTVVANSFVIDEIDLKDEDNFMGSDNVYDVAKRVGLWTPGQRFSFREVYGQNRGHMSTYCNRRVWRVLDLIAPSLKLPSSTDVWARDYPFSVKAERSLTVADIEAIQRDLYVGTEFDATKGPMGGPFGNPARYDLSPVDGMKMPELMAGRFERVISLFRTSYSFVTQSRAEKSPLVGPLTWFGQFTPHSTVYIPVYASVSSVPDSLSRGALQKMDRKANFWGFSAVGNYAAQWFTFAIEDVKKKQAKFEDAWFKEQDNVEDLADSITGYGGDVAGIGFLTDWCNGEAKSVLAAWWDFLDVLMAKYRDGYMMDNVHTETLAPTKLFYPRWWLEATGFWGHPGATAADAIEANEGEYDFDVIWEEEGEDGKGGKKNAKKAKAKGEKREKRHGKKRGESPAIEGAASPVSASAPAGGHGASWYVVSMILGAVIGIFGKAEFDRRFRTSYMPL